MAKDQSWLAGLLEGYRGFFDNTAQKFLPRRNYLRILGGATFVDNPNFKDEVGNVVGSTDVTFAGGGGASTFNPTLDGSSDPVAPGDSIVNKGNVSDANVIRAAAAAIDNAPGAMGVVTSTTGPGDKPTVVTFGNVPNSVTGLGVGAIARTIVNRLTGKLARVSVPRGHEAFIGNVDKKGNVFVNPSQHIGAGPAFTVKATLPPYNARPDMQKFFVAAPSGITPGAVSHLTGMFPAATFVPGQDEGKLFVLYGGADGTHDLHTTITSVDSDGSGVHLAAPLGYAGVLNTFLCYWGTDNTAAIQAAHDAAQALGHTVHLDYGMYMCGGTINWRDGVALSGDSRGSGAQFGSGSVLSYSGTGTFINFVSTGGVFASGQPMDAPWRNLRITTCTVDSQVGIHITDAFGVSWYDVTVYGINSFGANSSASGFTDCGIKLTSVAFGNAFQTFINCKAAFCAGDGLQITTNTFGLVWIGGGFSGCGGYGIHSKDPGGGATANIHVSGADFESCTLGGFGGYFDVVCLDGCYIEMGGAIGAGGPLVSIVAPAFGRVLEVRRCYLAKTGGAQYMIDCSQAGSVHTLICEGNTKPNPSTLALPGTATFTKGSKTVTFSTPVTIPGWALISSSSQPGQWYALNGAVNGSTTGTLLANFTGATTSGVTTTVQSIRSLIGAHNVFNLRYGPNYCGANVGPPGDAPIDCTANFGKSTDVGTDMVTYTAVLNSIATGNTGRHTDSPSANVNWDNAGQLTMLTLPRTGGVISVAATLSAAPTAGSWRVRVFARSANSPPTAGEPWKITNEDAGTPGIIQTDAPNPATNGCEVVISTDGLASAQGDWTATVLDPQHFTIPTTVTGTYTSGGQLLVVVRDTGVKTFPANFAETFASGSGQSTFSVEEQRLPAGVTRIGIFVSTSSDFVAPAGTAMQIDIRMGYQGHNIRSSEE